MRSGRGGGGGGDAARGGGFSGPAELVAKRGGAAEVGRVHDFEVLLVLRGGAGSDFVELLADVGFVDAVHAVEGGEKLVVAVGAGGWHKGSHGNGIDHGVVQMLVFEDVAGGNGACGTGG